MTRLEYLSQFSNAVLSPELNTCAIPLPKHGSGWASIFDYNNSELKDWEFEFRQDWCKQQIELIGEFGAVLGGGV
ncbi:hypothetical protein [Acinetobacter towneri]|uniref:Uncharacterized protein n=1 Tax=Acinetobacter towneri TaxID=202956 RepID=A0ABX7THX9_9GAMM|nr:hypothetical protein [Acinetobacter towneri]QTD62680.1 hypothetical protein J4G45_05875 [Acinetobacter towneri]